jgi:hypothetical protein
MPQHIVWAYSVLGNNIELVDMKANAIVSWQPYIVVRSFLIYMICEVMRKWDAVYANWII